MEYTVNDKRGKEPITPCCRVCGCPAEHSKEYNKPTMKCIEYLRGIISQLTKVPGVKNRKHLYKHEDSKK